MLLFYCFRGKEWLAALLRAELLHLDRNGGLPFADIRDHVSARRGSARVVNATTAAHQTPAHDAARWFCELDWVVDGIRE